jgi:glycerol-3-phosphate dehydrogenase
MVYDVAVIGCGVIGAATAYELSHFKLNVLVLEAENDVADGTTKANSAIIHAGYDPEPNTEMARLNVEGSKLAKDICKKLDVPYKQCGSLVLAFSDDEIPHLKKLYDNGVANGVPDIRVITGDEARKMEPYLSKEVVAALYAPSAAIVNPWDYALAMAETAVVNGVEIKLRSKVTAIKKQGDLFEIHTTNGVYTAKSVVNAAGVHAGEIHEMVAAPSFEMHPTSGQYYLMDRSEGGLAGSVIFQCPTKEGKGVLVAPTVHGNLIVGPDAVPCGEDDVKTTADGLDYVARMGKKSVPSVDLRASIRNFAGVRANTNKDDFIIEVVDGVHGFVDAAGIKSPGLSAAPAIAKKICSLLLAEGIEMPFKDNYKGTRKMKRFKQLSDSEKQALIRENPAYGRVICRCETITEGEILDAIRSPITPCSVDGIKRRCNAGMGRCQGGFCGPRVLDILARELGVSPLDILQDKDGTFILTGQTKKAGEGTADV